MTTRSQQGYLMFAALMLIFLMGIISVSITYYFTNNNKSILMSSLSEQAFYIAESGANQAMRYWYSKGVTCDKITGNADLTNATVGPGQFTVTGTPTTSSSSLSADISASTTSIPVKSTAGFAAQGAITIGSEAMYYSSISGNSFTGVIRGAGGTTASVQTNGASVSQIQCVLASTGAVPNLSSPIATRTLQVTMFSFPSSGSTLSSVISIGSVNLSNGSISNDHSCLTCSNYAGSNIQTNSKSNNFTKFSTQVDSKAADAGKLTNSSYDGNIMPDIMQGTNYTKNSLWSTYFSQSVSYVQANAGYVGTNVNGLKGVVIYAKGNVTLKNGSLGTASSPVILYVDGNVTMSSASVYGIIYGTGKLDLSNMSLNGSIASENNIILSGISITYDYALLNKMTTDPTFSSILNAGSVSGNNGSVPSPNDANTQEAFD